MNTQNSTPTFTNNLSVWKSVQRYANVVAQEVYF